MKMYMATISVHWYLFGNEHTEWNSILYNAENDNEAWGKAMARATEKWPASDGYFGHGCTTPCDVSDTCLWYAREMGFWEKEEVQHGRVV